MPKVSRRAFLFVLGSLLVALWGWTSATEVSRAEVCEESRGTEGTKEPKEPDTLVSAAEKAEKAEAEKADTLISKGTKGTKAKEADTLILDPAATPSPPAKGKESKEPDTLISIDTAPAVVEPGDDEIPGLSESVVQDIMRFRRGQTNLFDGTVFEEFGDPAAEMDFLKALRNAAMSAPRDAETSVGPKWSADDTIRWRNMQLVITLRQASRQLEARAADLEEGREYDEADRLRSLAQQLWREARNVAPNRAPVPAAVVPVENPK